MATMVKLQTVIIIVLSVVAVASATVLFVLYERPPTATASSSAKSDKSRASQPIPQRSPELDRYLQNVPVSQYPAMARAERQTQEDKMKRLKDLQTRFRELSVDGKAPDIDELDRLLDELVGIQGTSVIAGVDLNVLRQNLWVAKEVQALAKELEEESKKPKPDQNRMLEITKEIQEVQRKLRTDIMAGNHATGTMPPPATGTPKDLKGP